GGDSPLKIDDRDLGCKLSLGSATRADFHLLALPQFADAVTAQGFHVDENVRRIGPARHEAIALAAVEPFHDRIEGRASRLRQVAAARRRSGELRRGCRIVQRDHAARLQALRALHRFAHHSRAFIRGLETGLAYAGLMQQDISVGPARRFDEAVSFRKVKPLYEARYL